MSAGDLLLRSGLLDLEFYAAQVGRTFGDAAEAAEHAVAVGMPQRLSPNPFLDLVCLPVPVRRAWRAGRVGQLLDHLRSEEGRASPCGMLFDPRQVPGELPLATFLADAEESTPLPLPPSRVRRQLTYGGARRALVGAAATPPHVPPAAGRRVAGRTSVVIVDAAGEWRTTERSVRALLDNTPGADLEIVVLTVGQEHPVRQAVTAAYVGLPAVRVGHLATGPADEIGVAAATGDRVMLLPPATRVRRGWLAPLRDALADPEVTAAHPLLLDPDDLIAFAGPLRGHPKEDAAPHSQPPDSGPALVRVGGPTVGARRLVPTSLVSWYGDVAPPLDVAAAPRRTGTRWGIRMPSTAGVWGDDWGDTHFAESLAAAIRSLGADVVTYRRGALDAPVRELDDVSLAIRGLEPIAPVPGHLNVLWVISHPEKVTPEELEGYDVVLAASEVWAREAGARLGREIRPLLQATDVDERSWSDEPRQVEAVFVGGASRHRPMVDLAIEAGIPLAVHGHGWDHLPSGVWRSRHVPNGLLPRLYGRHRLVIADHWTGMAARGFVANRVFDAVAAGALVASDPVAGIEEHFGPAVVVCRSADDLRAAYDAAGSDVPPERIAVARRVIAEDSFLARARTFTEIVAGRGR